MYWKCNFLVKTKKCIQYYFIFKTPKCFSTGYWFLRIQNFYGHFSRSINTRWLSQTFICKLCQTTTNKQPWWQNFKGEKLMKSFIIDDKGQIFFLHTYIHDDTPRAVSFSHNFCKKIYYLHSFTLLQGMNSKTHVFLFLLKKTCCKTTSPVPVIYSSHLKYSKIMHL